MADTKSSALTALTGANLAATDLLMAVDVSDTTMAASGTNKKMTAAEFLTGLATISASATVPAGLTLASGTLTASAPVLNLTQTWNAAQTFEFGKKTLTDTSSNTESRFEAWYVGSALKASIRKDGALHLWNLATDASNYERGFMRWASNVLEIGTEKAGTGTARDVRILSDNFLFVTNQAGTSGNNIHAGRIRLTTSGDEGNIKINISAHEEKTQKVAAYDTVYSSTTSYNGTPDIGYKRSAAGVLKITDGSTGYGAIEGKLRTETAYAAGAPTATGYLTLYDNTGTAYKVPAVAV